MIQSGVTAPLKSKVVRTSIAASVTSYSCQVWGMSTLWHLSNPSYLKLSSPASRRLISPDTSHSPDRESLYPENNPALLPLHPKSTPAPTLLSVFLLFLFTLSIPIYPFPITSLCGLLFLSCLHLSLSSQILLLFYLAQSFPPPVFSPPSLLPGPGISCLCWWESAKRRHDCRLRNSLHFLKDSSRIQKLHFTPLGGCC